MRGGFQVVLHSYYLVCILRGLSSGVCSTFSLVYAERASISSHQLVVARGVGMSFAPVALSTTLGRIFARGELQAGFAGLLVIKMLAELLVSRIAYPVLLDLCYLSSGAAVALLDTSASFLVGHIYGSDCAGPMMLYCAAYGAGSMLSPWLIVALGESSWDAMALSDCALAATLLLLRAFGAPERPTPEPQVKAQHVAQKAAVEPAAQPRGSKRVPPRVLKAAMAFMLISECFEASMSSWCFTYAVRDLGLAKAKAAMLPSAFYLSFTAARVAMVPVIDRFVPSTLTNVAVALTLCGALGFYILTSTFLQQRSLGREVDDLEFLYRSLLGCLVFLGASTCPIFAAMWASVRRHGELTAAEQGRYDTCVNFGMTAGMWVPGLAPLPKVELVGALMIFLILSSHRRDFPWLEDKNNRLHLP